MKKRGYVTVAIVLVMFLYGPLPATSAGLPGYSGMVQISENRFLTVNDRKNPIESGYRLGIITLTAADGIVFTPLRVDDWMHEEKDPSDLEACCAIPGREGEFLIAESGFYNHRYGRIFHITLSEGPTDSWRVTINKVIRIYDRTLDAKGRSYKGDQVEAIACVNALGRSILIYGERGGQTHGGAKVGTIVWGAIDFGTYRFDKMGEAPLVETSLLGDRDCSALRLVPSEDGSFTVLSVATRDADDNGPFHSVLYRAGRLAVDPINGKIKFDREGKPEILSELSGIKVEALSGPAGNAPESRYSIATDDENFGGIWRPVFGN